MSSKRCVKACPRTPVCLCEEDVAFSESCKQTIHHDAQSQNPSLCRVVFLFCLWLCWWHRLFWAVAALVLFGLTTALLWYPIALSWTQTATVQVLVQDRVERHLPSEVVGASL